jgi:hypothetical protein
VITIQDRPAVTFATHEFCHTTGFSLVTRQPDFFCNLMSCLTTNYHQPGRIA